MLRVGQAQALARQGEEHGDNAALTGAIEVYKLALKDSDSKRLFAVAVDGSACMAGRGAPRAGGAREGCRRPE